jgi:peptidoglycan/xylan/chitin deacetylase (PgdA/CDA1 family)
MMRACLTVDLEPDCPPYLRSWRGVEEGVPLLLALLETANLRATFFTTGETALRYPDTVRAVARAGHEIGCHGHTHRSFARLSRAEADEELARSCEALAEHAPLKSFRAPYLRLPRAYLPLLEARGFALDSSLGRYKPDYLLPRPATRLERIPASLTSAALRLPPALRDPYLRALRSPAVLFVHPWEFVDMRAQPVRWDCRAGTGAPALASLSSALRVLRERGATFTRMDALLERVLPS